MTGGAAQSSRRRTVNRRQLTPASRRRAPRGSRTSWRPAGRTSTRRPTRSTSGIGTLASSASRWRVALTVRADRRLSRARSTPLSPLSPPPPPAQVGAGKKNIHFDPHGSACYDAMDALAKAGRFQEVLERYWVRRGGRPPAGRRRAWGMAGSGCGCGRGGVLTQLCFMWRLAGRPQGRPCSLSESGLSVTRPMGEGMEWCARAAPASPPLARRWSHAQAPPPLQARRRHRGRGDGPRHARRRAPEPRVPRRHTRVPQGVLDGQGAGRRPPGVLQGGAGAAGAAASLSARACAPARLRLRRIYVRGAGREGGDGRR